MDSTACLTHTPQLPAKRTRPCLWAGSPGRAQETSPTLSVSLQGHRPPPSAGSHPFPPGPSESLTSASFSVATPHLMSLQAHVGSALIVCSSFWLIHQLPPRVRGELCQILPTRHRAPVHSGGSGLPAHRTFLWCLPNELRREPLLTDSDWLESSWGCNGGVMTPPQTTIAMISQVRWYLQKHGASLSFPVSLYITSGEDGSLGSIKGGRLGGKEKAVALCVINNSFSDDFSHFSETSQFPIFMIVPPCTCVCTDLRTH